MKFVITVSLVLYFIMVALIHSENLYSQALPPNTSPAINNDRTHVSTTIEAAGNDESPVQSNTADGADNRLQNCGQTKPGKENSQSLNCQQNQQREDTCPVGYYRNSFGYCVPLLQ